MCLLALNQAQSISTSCSGRTGNGDFGYCSQRTLPTNSSLVWPQSCGAPYMWRGMVFETSSFVHLEATVASFFGSLTVSSSSCLQLPPPTVHIRCNRLHKIRTQFMPFNPIAVLLGLRVKTQYLFIMLCSTTQAFSGDVQNRYCFTAGNLLRNQGKGNLGFKLNVYVILVVYDKPKLWRKRRIHFHDFILDVHTRYDVFTL